MTSGLLYAAHPKRDYYRYLFWVVPEEIYDMNGQRTLLNEAWSPQFDPDVKGDCHERS